MNAKRQVPLRHLLPNLVTILAIVAGLTSLRMGVEGRLEAAVYLIILAMILDGADGKLARFLGSASPVGAELDTLADFFNFGIVPGIILFYTFFHQTNYANLGWICALALAICCALRLARFNVALADPKPDVKDQNYFVGVPAPALASLALMPVFLQLYGWHDIGSHPFLIALYLVFSSSLAISTIPTFSVKRLTVGSNHLFGALILAVILIISITVYTWASLVFLNFAYLCSLPLSWMRKTGFNLRNR